MRFTVVLTAWALVALALAGCSTPEAAAPSGLDVDRSDAEDPPIDDAEDDEQADGEASADGEAEDDEDGQEGDEDGKAGDGDADDEDAPGTGADGNETGDGSSDDAADAADEPWAPTWADVGAAQLRPGSPMPICTFDFLFVDPSNQTYYIGIAAHCVEELGEVVELDGRGPIGRVVFDSDLAEAHALGVEDRVDFALIELDEGVNKIAHPQMVRGQGPTGFIDCADVAVGDGIYWHGYGTAFYLTEQTRDRQGFITSCDGRDYAAATAAIFGDSGSGVLHESELAIGIVSRLGIDQDPPSELAGATIPYILREVAKAGFDDLELALIDGTTTREPTAPA